MHQWTASRKGRVHLDLGEGVVLSKPKCLGIIRCAVEGRDLGLLRRTSFTAGFWQKESRLSRVTVPKGEKDYLSNHRCAGQRCIVHMLMRPHLGMSVGSILKHQGCQAKQLNFGSAGLGVGQYKFKNFTYIL